MRDELTAIAPLYILHTSRNGFDNEDRQTGMLELLRRIDTAAAIDREIFAAEEQAARLEGECEEFLYRFCV